MRALGEGQRPAVVDLAGLGIETIGMGRDVAEQVQRVGDEAAIDGSGFDHEVTEASRLLEPPSNRQA